MRPADDRVEQMAQRVTGDLLAYFVRRVDDPADAADLLQDTLLVLCRRPSDIPVDADQQRLWAYGIARRVLSDQRRSRRRRGELHARLRACLEPDQHPAPEHDELHIALAELSEQDREIVRLIHWEGLRQVEVATVLGMEAATVRSRYLRARTQLKRLLTDEPAPAAIN